MKITIKMRLEKLPRSTGGVKYVPVDPVDARVVSAQYIGQETLRELGEGDFPKTLSLTLEVN